MAGTGSYQQVSEQTNIPAKAEKFDPQINHFGRIYVFAQFLVTTGLALYTLINAPGWDYQKTSWMVAFLTYSLCVHGFWLEGRTFSALHGAETWRCCPASVVNPADRRIPAAVLRLSHHLSSPALDWNAKRRAL